MGLRYAEDQTPDWNGLLNRKKPWEISDDERAYRQQMTQGIRERGDTYAKMAEDQYAVQHGALKGITNFVDAKHQADDRADARAQRATQQALAEEQLASAKNQRALDEQYSGRERETGLKRAETAQQADEFNLGLSQKYGDQKEQMGLALQGENLKGAKTQNAILDATGMKEAQLRLDNLENQVKIGAVDAATAKEQKELALQQMRVAIQQGRVDLSMVPLKTRALLAQAQGAEIANKTGALTYDQAKSDDNIKRIKAVLSSADTKEKHNQAIAAITAPGSGFEPWQVSEAISQLRKSEQEQKFLANQIAQTSPEFAIAMENRREASEIGKKYNSAIAGLKHLQDVMTANAGKIITPDAFVQARNDAVNTLMAAGKTQLAESLNSRFSAEHLRSGGYKSDTDLANELGQYISQLSEEGAGQIESLGVADPMLKNQLGWMANRVKQSAGNSTNRWATAPTAPPPMTPAYTSPMYIPGGTAQTGPQQPQSSVLSRNFKPARASASTGGR